MLRFKRISINNFYSVGHIDLLVNPGVHFVFGENLDAESKGGVHISNGAGKTTIFNALFQGLYNKNLKDPKGTIGSACNIYTGKPYSIEIKFEKDGIDYLIINDRNTNRIAIFEDGEEVSIKGITNQLTYIKNIIGMNFDTFSSLVFLTSASLENIIDISSKENIVYQFFNIDQIKVLEKSVKARVKELKDSYNILAIRKDSILSQLSLLDNIPKFDEDEINYQLANNYDALHKLEYSDLAKGIDVLKERYYKKKAECQSIYSEYSSKKTELSTYQELVEKLSKGTCPVCGAETKGTVHSLEETINDIKSSSKELFENYRECKDVLSGIETNLDMASERFESKRQKIVSNINSLRAKLQAAKETKVKLKELQESEDSFKELLQGIEGELRDLELRLDALKNIFSIIKTGQIVDEYLKNYTKLLQRNIIEYLKFSSFNIKIGVRASKGKLEYVFIDAGQKKTFTQLSSGERARVSIIILLATLKTIEQLSGISINILVLDELLGSLDKDGIAFLKVVLNELRKDKGIYLISHHGEMEENYADTYLHITKENNISTMEVTRAT